MIKTKKCRSVLFAAILFLLIGVIIFGSTTYAKYVYQEEMTSQSVNVAAWGFDVSVGADALFGTDYTLNSDEEEEYAKIAGSGTGVAVKASGKTLAPGTMGMMTFSVSGTAEVLSKITFRASGTDIGIKKADAEYYPVFWELKKLNDGLPTVYSGSFGGLIDYLNALSTTENVERVEAGQAVSLQYVLFWSWDFETGENADEKAANDAKDTVLGRFAAGKTVNGYTSDDVSCELEFELSITVEQIRQ